MAKPFSLFKRSSGIFYVQFLLPDGTRSTSKSTGCRNRSEAERTAMAWLVNGNIPSRINSHTESGSKSSIDKIALMSGLRKLELSGEDVKTIIGILTDRKLIMSATLPMPGGETSAEKYLSEFWDWEKSPYIRDKLVKGQSIHKSYCETMRSRVRIYWLPMLAGKSVGSITREDVKKIFENEKVKGLAPKTVNSIISSLTIPMKAAYFEGMTQNNCHEGIIKCANKTRKRGILTMEQATAVFRAEWDNDAAKLANMLAMCTGMRAGEIQALRMEDIGADRIYVRHSWSKYEGLKSCKNGEEREVPITAQMRELLMTQGMFNPHGEGLKGFVFFGEKPSQPVDAKTWLKCLRRVQEQIGYSAPREICFHSWRHLWCSRVSDVVSDKRAIMSVSGHRTETMLNHYAAHIEEENAMGRIRLATERLFLPVVEESEGQHDRVQCADAER